MSKREGHLSNEGAQGAERALEKRKRQQAEHDLEDVMGTPQGRRFFWRVVDEFCGLTSVTEPGNGEENTFRHEGARAVGALMLEHARAAAPELLALGYSEQMKAAAEERIRRDAARKDAEASGDEPPTEGEVPDGD